MWLRKEPLATFPDGFESSACVASGRLMLSSLARGEAALGWLFAIESIELHGFSEAAQPVAAERLDRLRTDHRGEFARQQKRAAGGAADRGYAAHQIDVGANDREVEPAARADIAVAHRTVMKRYPGAERGVGRSESGECGERTARPFQRRSGRRRRVVIMIKCQHS